jgi:hypothetical protein
MSTKYIIPHPFVRIDGLDPIKDAVGPYVIRSDNRIFGQAPGYVLSGSDLLRRPPPSDIARRHRFETLTKTSGVHVSWDTLRKECGFAHIGQIHKALYVIEDDGPPDEDAVRLLNEVTAVCAVEKWFFPTSGYVPPSLERPLAKYLDRLNFARIQISDKYQIDAVVVPTSRLAEPEPLGHEFLQNPTRMLGSAHDIVRIATDGEGVIWAAREASFFSVLTIHNHPAPSDDIFPDMFPLLNDDQDSWWLT